MEHGEIKKGEKTVVVIRYEGPRGGPGMPGIHHSPNQLTRNVETFIGIDGCRIRSRRRIINRRSILRWIARFSHRYTTFVVANSGHIVPEAQSGGPIALVEDGDRITISADRRVIDLDVSEEELARRRKEWKEPPLKYNQGTLFKYAKYYPLGPF